MVSYLLSHFPVDNEILKDLGRLHPEHRLESGIISAIERLARKLSLVQEEDVPLIANE